MPKKTNTPMTTTTNVVTQTATPKRTRANAQDFERDPNNLSI